MHTPRNHYPAGVPCWIDMTPADVDAAIEFYTGLFGWEVEQRTPPGAPQRYLIASLHGLTVAGIGSPIPGTRSAETAAWSTYVAVEDADRTAERVREAGGRVLYGPADAANAGRWVECLDPEGAVFSLWQPRDRAGVQLVNSPGSWNSSDLGTADPERAAAFYGAVFGWIVRPMSAGFADAKMWCLPGYGDFLETIEPGVHERHAQAGAPEGFTDAIGWMLATATTGDLTDQPPAWNVTFGVDDTDAAVDRARKLGATVVVEPFDAEPVRMAVLVDPQGAAFNVSHYREPT